MFGLNTYRKREKLKIDREMFEYRKDALLEVESLRNICLQDKASYEHEFHSAKEERGIELAKLDALKETHENDITTYKLLIKNKDEEIERMNALCSKLSESKIVIIKSNEKD